MTRTMILSAAAGVCMFGLAGTAFAGEYDNMCAMGLALGKKVQTDCSINETIDGKTYCFGNENAKTMFMKDPQGNLAKAKAFVAPDKS